MWKLNNVNNLNKVRIPLFQKIFFPIYLLPFHGLNINIEREKGTNNAVTVQWENVCKQGQHKHAGVDNRYRYDTIKIQPIVHDIADNLLIIKQGISRLWFNKPTNRSLINAILSKKGFTLTSCEQVLTDKNLRISIHFGFKNDKVIAQIVQSPLLRDLCIERKKRTYTCRINNGFYFEDRDKVHIIATKKNAQKIRKVVKKTWPLVYVDLKKTVDAEATSRAVHVDITKMEKLYTCYLRCMNDPTPPHIYKYSADNDYVLMPPVQILTN